MKFRELIKVTGLPVFLASLCCLAPIVLVLLGISTISTAISLVGLLDGQYKWAFLLVGFVSLVISLVIYFRSRGVCSLDLVKKHRNEIINKSLLFLIGAVVLYVLFFYVFLGFVGQLLGLWK
ncbi:MAG TPA: hypothetical protein VLI92_03270 [Candidatus Saccharimonadales bacterium]|nr:hypothetical protein [Candidatus Saccharimonadales bacterium]